jgi:hypothetical protein
VTTTDGSNNRTRAVTTKSLNGTLIGSSAITTSADSLTQTVEDDINADGVVDRTTVQATVLGSDGSRTVTTTTTTKIDANGDTKIDQTHVAALAGRRSIEASRQEAGRYLTARTNPA